MVAEGNGEDWTTPKVLTLIISLVALLVSGAMAFTSNYGKKFDATATILSDHDKRITILEDRILTKEEKQALLEIISERRRQDRSPGD